MTAKPVGRFTVITVVIVWVGIAVLAAGVILGAVAAIMGLIITVTALSAIYARAKLDRR